MKSSKPLFPRPKQGRLTVGLSVALIFVTACASFSAATTPAISVSSLSTQVAATLQALTPAMIPTIPATAIPASATPVPPTSTPPPPTPIPAPPGSIRIDFATGATASNTPGTIAPGQTQSYLVRALKGQPMIAMVDSPGHDLTFSISGLQSGQVLLPASNGRNTWQGTLPATDDYVVRVIGGATTQNFNLSLTIASRISFAPGADSAVVSGSTQGGFNVTFALYASAGQAMDLNLDAPTGKAALEVWGFGDGQPYLRSQLGETAFSLKLPSTQDYIIAVVPFAGGAVNFSLHVKVK